MGNVASNGSQVGGLVGLQETLSGSLSSIVNSYAEGAVSADNFLVGGLVGLQYSDGSGSGSKIENSNATGNVIGSNYIGGLVGQQSSYANSTSVITGGNATGSVNGDTMVGGLVGLQNAVNSGASYITNCFAKGAVAGVGGQVGGFVGLQESAYGSQNSIVSSFAEGDVSAGGFNAGGFVGLQFSDESGSNAKIENSYATGNVSGVNYVGGFTGQQGSSLNSVATITYCYATGNVSGDYAVSSFVGFQYFTSTGGNNSITGSYATGNIICSTSQYGGIVGLQEIGAAGSINTITNCYRYVNLTVNGSVIPTTDPDSATNRKHGGVVTADNLMTKATYTGNSWLFNDSAPAAGPWNWDVRGFPKLNLGTENFPFPFVATPVIAINTQPQANTTVTAGSITGSLSVSASVTGGGTLGYQWYSNTTNSNTGGAQIAGATGANFNIPTGLTVGTYYYYCVVSSSGAVSVPSNVATVNVTPPVSIPTITINTHPANTTVTVDSITGSLSVSASVTGGGTLSYQWYSNTTNSNTGGAQIAGATSANFNIPTGLTTGTYYYYCVVSSTGAASVTSNVARVTVEEERGCNAAGFGYLAFALLGFMPYAIRKRR